MVLEKLHRALVFFGCRPRAKGAEIPSFAGFRILLSRGFQVLFHLLKLFAFGLDRTEQGDTGGAGHLRRARFPDSIQLAESMEARAFGSGRRTHYAISTWSRLDALIIGGAAAAAAVFVAARLTGAAPDWDPYPALRAPATSPIAVMSCLPLLLPLAARWR